MRRTTVAPVPVLVIALAGIAGAQSPITPLCQATGSCPTSPTPTCSFPASGQTTKFVNGDDGDLESGAALSYADNGDGTITDLNTGLVWEKKVELDDLPDVLNLNDADNCYPWQGLCSVGGAACGTDSDCPSGATCDVGDCQRPASPNGMTVFEWVVALNAESFAGHSDWRVPNVRELQSLVDYGRLSPTIDPAFDGSRCGTACASLALPECACTETSFYWSSTTRQGYPNRARGVYFGDGFVSGSVAKDERLFVRAVRGGS